LTDPEERSQEGCGGAKCWSRWCVVPHVMEAVRISMCFVCVHEDSRFILEGTNYRYGASHVLSSILINTWDMKRLTSVNQSTISHEHTMQENTKLWSTENTESVDQISPCTLSAKSVTDTWLPSHSVTGGPSILSRTDSSCGGCLAILSRMAGGKRTSASSSSMRLM